MAYCSITLPNASKLASAGAAQSQSENRNPVPDFAFMAQNPSWRGDMCNACAELDRQIGHLRVIEKVADTGTSYAATKLIEEKEAEKAKLHVRSDDLHWSLNGLHQVSMSKPRVSSAAG